MEYSEGLLAVKKDSKWGYADTTGEVVIDLTYEHASGFSEGMAVIRLNEKYGFIRPLSKLPQLKIINRRN
ncbi:hypothetical protein B5J94_05580 [Moraxella lacunata]|uniref:WG repeat-containing protein n=2 Tax=Moraxella lacunata TaxID=477 RepID=A0A1V4GYN9_MORLA|nr:hypothetical protein B5J94_05580 [Moraxella lacunata]